MDTKLKPPAFGTYQSDNIKLIARCNPGEAGQITIEGNFDFIAYMHGSGELASLMFESRRAAEEVGYFIGEPGSG